MAGYVLVRSDGAGEYAAVEAADVMQYAHGTITGYIAGGCRCAACRQARRNYGRRYRRRKQADGFAGLRHGTAATYAVGCRCGDCTAAEARRDRVARRRRAQNAQ